MPHVLAQDLRNAVLQAAMQGKLTEQLKSDSAVDCSLLKTKNYSKLENELELPESWINSHLEDITKSLSTKQYQILDSEIKSTGKYPVISQSKQYSIGFSDEETKVLRHDKKLVAFGDHTTVVKTVDFPFVVGADGVKLFETTSNILPDYLYHCLTYYANEITEKGGYSRHYKFLKNKSIPLPPIEEQARIVARVDELMAKIDEYEKIEKELTELQKAFPGNMKDAILQAAMQGKLTEQLESDAPQTIKPDVFENKDLLFDIPDNWQWNQIGSAVNVTTGLSFNKQEQCEANKEALRILRGGNVLDNYKYGLFDNDVYVAYRDKYTKLEVGDVLSPSVTSMEKMCKVAYIDKELPNTTAGGFVYILRSKDINLINPRYLMYFFNSDFNRQMCKPNIHKSGQAFYNLKKSGLITQPIPLPPIEEQQRIVDKLDRLLPLCENLEAMI